MPQSGRSVVFVDGARTPFGKAGPKGLFAETRDGLGQQGFARAGRPDHQHAARNASAQLLELGGVAQELDELFHVVLGFVAARDVGERDAVAALVEQSRLALAERERTAAPATLHLAHEEI